VLDAGPRGRAVAVGRRDAAPRHATASTGLVTGHAFATRRHQGWRFLWRFRHLWLGARDVSAEDEGREGGGREGDSMNVEAISHA